MKQLSKINNNHFLQNLIRIIPKNRKEIIWIVLKELSIKNLI